MLLYCAVSWGQYYSFVDLELPFLRVSPISFRDLNLVKVILSSHLIYPDEISLSLQVNNHHWNIIAFNQITSIDGYCGGEPEPNEFKLSCSTFLCLMNIIFMITLSTRACFIVMCLITAGLIWDYASRIIPEFCNANDVKV